MCPFIPTIFYMRKYVSMQNYWLVGESYAMRAVQAEIRGSRALPGARFGARRSQFARESRGF
jgi:hypothetical protein